MSTRRPTLRPRGTLIVPALIAAVLCAAPSSAPAAQGDCGQPVSTGDTPTASDALLILRAAVGAASCDNDVCDVDGGCTVTASDALRVLRFAVGQPVTLECTCVTGTTSTSSTVPPTSTSTTVTTTTTTTTTTTVPAVSWAEVFAIFEANFCGQIACHGEFFPEENLTGLQDIDLGYAAIVGIPSTQVPSLDLVEPGNPDASYLFRKIEGTFEAAGGEGVQMPKDNAALSPSDIEKVRNWIAGGALR